jgi:Undecaprenyl-phosphate galactose phosphotransferase WbaP
MSATARPAPASLVAPRWPWAAASMVIADVLALQLSLVLGLATRLLLWRWFDAEIGPEQYLAVAVGILLLPVVHYQLGLYPGYLVGPVERLRRRILATLAVFGGLVAWDNLVARGVLSRGVLLATLAFALVLPPLSETLVRTLLIARNRWGIRAVVLGAGKSGKSIARMLQRDPRLGLKPVVFLDDRPVKWHTTVEGVPVAGPLAHARDFEDRAEVAIVALKDVKRDDFDAFLQDLQYPRVIVVPDLAALASLWATARDLNGCLGLEIKKNLLVRRNTALKRLMDQCLALPLFLMSLPVMGVAAVWIKLASRGPAFYCQEREGFEGKRLKVWKLRTMHVDAARLLDEWLETHPEDRMKWSRYFKLPHDPRVLPVIGRLLRRTSLDELPQLWSVLKGEMSLVGPRPFPDYHLQHFSSDFRTLRTRVLPGLTGLWQISARGDGDVEVQETLDTYYIRNWSPWMDLYILARTVAAVLLARGAY